jgi:hypothetical protein
LAAALGVAAGGLAAAPGPLAAAAGAAVEAPGALATLLVPLPHPRRGAEVTPLSPDRYRYQLTIGGTTLEKLRLAKDMLRHALPSGDDEAILDRALTALITDLARKKFGKLGAGRKTGSSGRAAPDSGRVGATDSRLVPAAVKRAVWLRDSGRCAFVGTDGRRCDERAFVEFHHLRPHAVGGEATVGNIELRCRRHNGYEARQYFGREPVGEGQHHAGPGSPARASGPIGGSSSLRSGTNPRDHEVVSLCAGALTT